MPAPLFYLEAARAGDITSAAEVKGKATRKMAQLGPLAPGFRVVSNAEEKDDLAQLSDGEYRTVLAAQRTLLAFLRTALAVLVVFRDSAFGPVLASLVALTGIVQFATAAPLYLTPEWRVPKPGSKGGRVDAHLLFRWTQAHSLVVCALVVVCVSIAIPWRFNREVEDVSATAQTAIEVFD